jgi:hypothetical protein
MEETVAKKFVDLTSEQKTQFEAKLKLFGIPLDQVTKSVETDADSIVHHDPELSTMKMFHTVVKDLSHLKQLCGVPDSAFEKDGIDAHIQYPAALHPDRARLLSTGRQGLTEAVMSPAEHKGVEQAMLAYTLGNSSKVPPEYVTLANSLKFPTTLAVAPIQDLVVKTPFPVRANLICGTITVLDKGYLQIEEDVHVSAQVFTADTAKVAGPSGQGITSTAATGNLTATPAIQSIGVDGSKGTKGRDAGGTASSGKPGSSGTPSKHACDTAGADGVVGTKGTDGGDGSPGTTGGDAKTSPIELDEISGNFIVAVSGGSGGAGGDGGKGQKGGTGGTGAAAASTTISGGDGTCAATSNGNGGDGGTGGAGGAGADGGNGGIVNISYRTQAPGTTLNFTVPKSGGGAAGAGGDGGDGGDPGNGSGAKPNTGTSGGTGGPGANSTIVGKPGNPGTVNFILL